MRNNSELFFDSKSIATGDTAEEMKIRKRFIIDFYAGWVAANPTKNKSVFQRYLFLNMKSQNSGR
jgi:hypothetical protein